MRKQRRTTRKCRKCNRKLPREKYFYHTNCAPKGNFRTDDGYLYFMCETKSGTKINPV